MRALSLLLTLAAAPLALASPQLSAPDANGFVWATIGAPGNPHAPQVGGFWPSDPPRGAVDYEYRMSRNELTLGQWFEFVNAYSPFAEFPNSPSFTGEWIGSNHDGTYVIAGNATVVQHFPAEVTPRYAARFVNWLHNGKTNESWAFESGVYDTSTFGQAIINGSTVYTDEYTRSPNAKYWIPSLNEWVKGMYYDPNRYGDGQEGYWPYPHSNDQLPVYGYPEDGAETNAGAPGLASPFFIPVGAYPDVQSPWGLLDGSGSVRELVFFEDGGWIGGEGSTYLTTDLFHLEIEHYEQLAATNPQVGRAGLRLAAAIPGPMPILLFGIFTATTCFLRKRTPE